MESVRSWDSEQRSSLERRLPATEIALHFMHTMTNIEWWELLASDRQSRNTSRYSALYILHGKRYKYQNHWCTFAFRKRWQSYCAAPPVYIAPRAHSSYHCAAPSHMRNVRRQWSHFPYRYFNENPLHRQWNIRRGPHVFQKQTHPDTHIQDQEYKLIVSLTLKKGWLSS